MSNITYLITGATGATGSEAATTLLTQGESVRAFVHRDDERAARLREQDFDTVRAALRGVQRAYFVYPIAPGIVPATTQFAQAAKEAGVEAIVNMSQKPAREEVRSHASRQHWIAERVFDGVGVPVTHLRPTFFAEWLLYVAPMIRGGTIYAPFGEGRHACIAAADQGRVIAAILRNPRPHAGQTYALYGAVEHTWPETAAILSQVLGRKVDYRQVPFKAFEASLTEQPKSAHGNAADFSFLFQHLREAATDHDNGIFTGTNDLVEQITGQLPMTVENFIATHRAAFSSEGENLL